MDKLERFNKIRVELHYKEGGKFYEVAEGEEIRFIRSRIFDFDFDLNRTNNK